MSDVDVSFEGLVERARALTTTGERVILGIVGPPGSGKSLFTELLVSALGRVTPVQAADEPWVCNVPMDGFHLADVELRRLNRADRKGAPDTFDAYGFCALLRRLLEHRDQTVYAPAFDRTIDQPIAGSIAIGPAARLILTEGNYLLAEVPPWPDVRSLMTEVWYCDADERRRVRQLARRHVEFGKSPSEAQAWVERSDRANADIVVDTRRRADLLIPESTLASLLAVPRSVARTASGASEIRR